MPTNEQLGLAANLCIIAASFVLTVLQILSYFRRTPPIDVDLERIKTELRMEMDARWLVYRAELDARLTGLSGKIELRTSELRAALDSAAAAAGELERHITTRFTEVIEKIGELRAGKKDKT